MLNLSLEFKAAISSLFAMSIGYVIIMLGIDLYFKFMGFSYSGGILYYLLYYLIGLLPVLIWLSLVSIYYRISEKKNFSIILVVGILLTGLIVFAVNGENYLSRDFLVVLGICEIILLVGTWMFDIRFKELGQKVEKNS